MNISNGRRLTAAMLAAAALTGVLASCGDSNDNSSTASGGGMAGMEHARTPASTPKPISEASAADVDGAFVRQMIPHHQMAVMMAEMAQKQGQHKEIKTLAADIIAAQNKEITQLKAIATELGVTPDKPMTGASMGDSKALKADAATLALAANQMGMSMDMTKLDGADPFDQAFIAQMTEHHQGAVAMAKAELKRGANTKLRAIATGIIAAQEKEIAEMKQWNANWYGSSTSPDHSDMPGM